MLYIRRCIVLVLFVNRLICYCYFSGFRLDLVVWLLFFSDVSVTDVSEFILLRCVFGYFLSFCCVFFVFWCSYIPLLFLRP